MSSTTNPMHIHTVHKKEEEKILRLKTKPFNFEVFSRTEVRELVKTMRIIMKRERGIGLAANQIGLDTSVFTAELEGEFFAIFNPRITKKSELIVMEEGCLSVPGKYGSIKRYNKVTLEGQDQAGKKIKIKAVGLLAEIFQHETDHLNGILYTDTASEIRDVVNSQNEQ